MLTSIRNVKFIKMRLFTMFGTAVCVLFLIKLRWPKNKSLYVNEQAFAFVTGQTSRQTKRNSFSSRAEVLYLVG